jgi:hypothetical protein
MSRGVLSIRHMNIHMTCPWCQDELPFVVDDSTDELVCNGCSTRMAFAPDPVVTYGLLYEAAA